MIRSSGVVTVNSAQAARKIELTTALITMTLRKPKVLMMRAASVFMPMGAGRGGECHEPGAQRRQAESDLLNSGSRNGNEPMPRRKQTSRR